MKKIVKVQSISDIITNSSSEVFVMTDSNAHDVKDDVESHGGYCDLFNKLTYEYILNNSESSDTWEMICEIIGASKGDVSHYVNYDHGWGWWADPSEEDWKNFCEIHKQEIMEKIVNADLWIIEFNDHFEDSWDVNENARDLCIATKNHH